MSDATIEVEVKVDRDLLWDVSKLVSSSIDDLKTSISYSKEIEYNQKEQEYTMIKTALELINKQLCNLGETVLDLVEAVHELKGEL